MFDVMKKANALKELGKEVKELTDQAMAVDANDNGVKDIPEIFGYLKELPDLIQKEGSEVLEEAEDARKKIGDHLRAIASLAGETVEEIQEHAAPHIESIKKQLATLEK